MRSSGKGLGKVREAGALGLAVQIGQGFQKPLAGEAEMLAVCVQDVPEILAHLSRHSENLLSPVRGSVESGGAIGERNCCLRQSWDSLPKLSGLSLPAFSRAVLPDCCHDLCRACWRVLGEVLESGCGRGLVCGAQRSSLPLQSPLTRLVLPCPHNSCYQSRLAVGRTDSQNEVF